MKREEVPGKQYCTGCCRYKPLKEFAIRGEYCVKCRMKLEYGNVRTRAVENRRKRMRKDLDR